MQVQQTCLEFEPGTPILFFAPITATLCAHPILSVIKKIEIFKLSNDRKSIVLFLGEVQILIFSLQYYIDRFN